MKCNGFDSDNYRYFRNLEDGMIIKYSNEELKSKLFNDNFYLRVVSNIENYQIREYPSDRPFNLLEYIKMQAPLVFKYSYILDLQFEKDEYCLVTNWLSDKLNTDEIIGWRLFSSGQTIREANQSKLEFIDEEEVIDVRTLGVVLGLDEILVESKELNIKTNNINMYKFNRGISLTIPFKENEVWSLTNPALSLALLNQKFISQMYRCEELLGTLKEQIFWEEYKDNVPGKLVRYYKLKDDVRVNKMSDLMGSLSLNDLGYNYCSLVARCNGKVNFCKYNPNNYNKDGTFRYIYVEYFDGVCDWIISREILKIADRLPYNEALEKHKEDLQAYEQYLREQEAIEYVMNHQKEYRKIANQMLTPLQFMTKEQERHEKELNRRLIRCLTKRMGDLDKKY